MKLNIFDLLEQDELWIDRRGNAFLIKEMDKDYRNNVLQFLAQRVEILRVAWIWEMPFPNMNGDVAQHMAEQDWEKWQNDAIGMPIDEWLAERPLVKALSSE